MWKFNNTNELYPNSDHLYHSADELYHYGVLGMKWGHRKSSAVQSAHKAYKQSKKEYRRANIKKFFSKSTYAAGHDNNVQAAKNQKRIDNARKNREKAAFKLIDSAAKDAYNKKLAKTGSKEKANKASMKVHLKAFNQSTYGKGRVGSIADAEKHHGVKNGNENYYNHLVKTKGKKYASAVEKKYNKKTTRALVGSAVVLTGLTIAQLYDR